MAYVKVFRGTFFWGTGIILGLSPGNWDNVIRQLEVEKSGVLLLASVILILVFSTALLLIFIKKSVPLLQAIRLSVLWSTVFVELIGAFPYTFFGILVSGIFSSG